MKQISGHRQQEWNSDRPASWDFLTNHAHVLRCLARDPTIRLRDIAGSVGITERTAHGIQRDLVREGYVLRQRQGRRNHYEIVREPPLRHRFVPKREMGDLLEVLTAPDSSRAPPAEGPAAKGKIKS